MRDILCKKIQIICNLPLGIVARDEFPKEILQLVPLDTLDIEGLLNVTKMEIIETVANVLPKEGCCFLFAFVKCKGRFIWIQLILDLLSAQDKLVFSV